MNQQVLEIIQNLAKQTMAHEDKNFIPDDWFGSNIDDAYWRGMEDGAIGLAKQLLDIIEGDK